MIASAGVFAPHALLLQTAVMACIAIAFWRLAEVEPSAGSSYSWVRSAFGPRTGAYAAWLLIVANYFATMATAIPAGTYSLDLIAPHLAAIPLWNAIVGCVWIVACAALLYLGVRPTAIVTLFMLVAELLVLLIVAVVAVFTHPPHVATGAHAVPLTTWGFLSASVLAIWMVDGWEVSASTSEESKGSSRVPGFGGLWGLLATCAIMLVCMLAFVAAFGARDLADHQADALAFIGTSLGGAWGPVLIVTVLVSTAAALSTTMLYLSRSVFAMGRDGLLPIALGRLDRRGDPTTALIVVTAGVLGSTLLSGLSASAAQALQFVLGGSSVFLGALFLLSALAAARRFAADRGARRWTGVFIPMGGATVLFAMLAATTLFGDPLLRTAIFIGLLAGLPFAWWRARRIVPISG